MQRFTDKVIIVTGASSGIGAATARRFAAEGGSVVLVARRLDRLDALAAELPDGAALAVECDVADSAAVNAMVAQVVARFGRIDVLVNNAGVAVGGQIETVSDDDWARVMAVNVNGVFHGVRAAMPHLRESAGNIVNVSSVSGIRGDWGLSPYNASKGAVSNFTRALALDAVKTGVRVNAVAPSLTRSEMVTRIMDNDDLMEKVCARNPLGRICEAEEIASVIAFLASGDASFVNGVVMPVDGGVSASNGQPALR
ncbi:MAG: meso-butanediol dehydrogenase/(S,S)-butanediol dehydrogenase/diacetyl reductase [Paracoccaceae bacterium]|jgi:meso-butanediol dehydrogenase/(S,S)-butanediol dehydrogenase/diacetyl reductase